MDSHSVRITRRWVFGFLLKSHCALFLACSLALAPGSSFSGAFVGSAAAQSASEGTGVRTVYLIRHGQYASDEGADPDVGKALVPLGIAQSRLVAARLKSLEVEFNSLLSSTMTRARQTAAVIGADFPELEHHQSRLIRECVPPTWRQDIMEDYADEEDFDECASNLDEAFAELFTPSADRDRHDIVVCHGNVIRYFVTKALAVDTMAWLGFSIGNCSLTTIRVNPDGSLKVFAYGDVGHIPPNLQTETGGPDKPLVVPGE